MTSSSLPRYSRQKLSYLANNWLNSINIPLFEHKYLNIDNLLTYLKKNSNIHYQEKNLGGIDNHKILGLMVPQENSIYIDPILNNNYTMKRFTQAHEIAHWVLHKDLNLSDYDLSDTKDKLNQSRTLSTTYDWVEWQANTFASFLLIPEKRFINAFKNALNLLQISKSIHELEPFQQHKIQKICAHTFQVSQTVIGIYYQHIKSKITSNYPTRQP